MDAETTIRVAGDVSGQLAVGEFVYQAQVIGGVLNQIRVEGPPIVARPTPIDLRGPPPVGFVGRHDESQQVLAHLAEGAVQVFGPDGVGKTFLLRHLVHGPVAGRAADGAALVTAIGQPVEDILQAVFEIFYESALPQLQVKATPTQIRTAMADRRAFLAIDDVNVPRSELERLLLHLPGSMVVVSGDEETLLGSGWSLRLPGLVVEAAREVLLAAAGQELDAEDVDAMLVAAGGHPATLVRIGRALARGEAGWDTALDAAELDFPERRALGVLGAVGGRPLPVEAVGDAAEISDALPVLEGLRRRDYALAASPRYRLAGDVVGVSDDWTEATARRLAAWTRHAPAGEVIAAGAALSRLVELAAGAGYHAEALDLARAALPPLAGARRWGTARQMLTVARQSSEQIGDTAAQGWALHELGTFAASLGERDAGIGLLRKAESLRAAAGDLPGLDVTRHNLGQLLPAPIPPDAPPPEASPPEPPRPKAPRPKAPGPPRRRGWLRWFAVIVAIATVVGVIWYVNRDDNGPLRREVTVTSVLRSEPRPVEPRSTEPRPTEPTDPIDGTGPPPLGPILGLETSSFEFGEVDSYASDSRSREIWNDGDEPLEVTSFLMAGASNFRVEPNDCGYLEPGSSCTFEVIFDAGSSGQYEAVLTVESNGGSVEIPVLGTVVDLVPDLSGSIISIGRGETVGLRIPTEVSVEVTAEITNLGGPFESEFRLQFDGYSDGLQRWLPAGVGPESFSRDGVFVGPLEPDQSVVVTSWVTFQVESYLGQSVIGTRLIVDGCFAEEFVEDWCRVEESDEGNNVSAVIDIDLGAIFG